MDVQVLDSVCRSTMNTLERISALVSRPLLIISNLFVQSRDDTRMKGMLSDEFIVARNENVSPKNMYFTGPGVLTGVFVHGERKVDNLSWSHQMVLLENEGLFLDGERVFESFVNGKSIRIRRMEAMAGGTNDTDGLLEVEFKERLRMFQKESKAPGKTA